MIFPFDMTNKTQCTFSSLLVCPLLIVSGINQYMCLHLFFATTMYRYMYYYYSLLFCLHIMHLRDIIAII